MIRLVCLRRATYFVQTPFDCQPMKIPKVASLAQTMDKIIPQKGISREDEVKLLLEKLPLACKEAKEQYLVAQRASRYYRARYGRGSEVQRKQAKMVLEMPDEDVVRWARSRCMLVRDPLDA
ncbi:unnamed protein product [Phytomonas sp. EM1]|nr:unnamed protein product [Phytomonas sp. EM1]|eukprot:CCW64433.1 unnamed protein product [Phytomonas sp. isolate EM1]